MDDDITLITSITTVDDDGFEQKEEKKSEIFGKVTDTKRSEFYQALADGIKATKTIQIFKDDYEDACVSVNKKKKIPSKVICNNETYKIERTYGVSDDVLELICSEV